jgi:predicted phage terminase large subunit-like protein
LKRPSPQVKSQELAAQAARDSLLAFAVLTHPNYEAGWHHRKLAEYLEAIERREINRLVISMPPRHGKTELASIRFAPWYLGRNPTHNVIQATYSGEFAEDNGRKTRALVATPEYKAFFGFGLDQSSKAVSRWQTERGGTYFAVGVGGPLTGRGGNVLLIDDPHKNRQEAESATYRQRAWDWFASTAYTRLEKNGIAIIIMTRWHEDDLVGRVLNGSEHWDQLVLPAIAETDEPCRTEGEALWPEKFNTTALAQIRETVGSREWASLYQQRPAAAEGNVFQRDWFRFYNEAPVFKRVVQSWDTAFKAGQDNDRSACTTWGVADDGYYLLDCWAERVEFPELKRQVVMLAAKWAPSDILVEDKASGQSLLQELKRDTRLPLLAVKVDRDKLARAYAVTPLFESGRVRVPSSAPWIADYIDEMASFPAAAHDDRVDSTTQALERMALMDKPTPTRAARVNFMGR